MRHGTPPASRDVPGERGRLSGCIWNLGIFPNDARKNCPFVLTSFTGWSSKRCPGIGFLSRGDREIGVLRNVEPPTRPRLECLRETGLILRCDRKVGNPFQTKQGSRPSRPDQEGRKGSEEGVPENLRVPLISDSDPRVPADLGKESQASSCVEAWNSVCLSRCPRGERPLVELSLEPGVFFRTTHGKTALSC